MGEVNDKLGVEVLTPDELSGMAEITRKCLFVRDYGKSDSVLDMMKLFKMEDTTENRRFTLAVLAFGGALSESQRMLGKLVEVISDI